MLSVDEPAPIAVLKSDAFNAVIVLLAFILRKVIAPGLLNSDIFVPAVVNVGNVGVPDKLP